MKWMKYFVEEVAEGLTNGAMALILTVPILDPLFVPAGKA